MISDSSNIFSRFIWLILFLACMLVLYQNARSVVAKYNRSEKIVNIQLKFGTFYKTYYLQILYSLLRQCSFSVCNSL